MNPAQPLVPYPLQHLWVQEELPQLYRLTIVVKVVMVYWDWGGHWADWLQLHAVRQLWHKMVLLMGLILMTMIVFV